MHTIEIFSQTTFHKNLAILSFKGAELAGRGKILPPPPPGRVILNPIPGRGFRLLIVGSSFADYRLGLMVGISLFRRLHEAQLFGRVAVSKSLLSEANKRTRLTFAQSMLQRGAEFWRTVVFSDEKTFCTSRHGRLIVYR